MTDEMRDQMQRVIQFTDDEWKAFKRQLAINLREVILLGNVVVDKSTGKPLDDSSRDGDVSHWWLGVVAMAMNE